MFGGYWYNSSMRRYVVMMGDLFSHVQVLRRNEDGISTTRVPITYASKERFVDKLSSISNVNHNDGVAKVETILPRMYLNMVDIQYNSQYKTNIANYNKIAIPNSATELVSQYNPTPIKMIFELGIFTRYQDDMFQIIEQILPYFQPHFTTQITELYDNVDPIERDIRIVLSSVSPDETHDGGRFDRRRLEWTIMFEVNGWIYPPVAEIKGEIKTIYLDFFANEKVLDNESNFESVDYQIAPESLTEEEWIAAGRPLIESTTENIPIPVAPEKPHVRTQ